MEPRHFLRIEGAAELAAALGAYVAVDGPLWMLLVLVLVPDVSMLGYLAGPRVGSLTYNVVHTYALPLALAGAGVYAGSTLAVQLAAIWAAHVGLDRTFGFGLKYPTGFRDTHLGEQPAPAVALVDTD